MKGVKGELPDEMGKAGARQLKNGSPREKKRQAFFSCNDSQCTYIGQEKKEKKKKTDVRGTIKPGPERYAVSRRMRKKRKKKESDRSVLPFCPVLKWKGEGKKGKKNPD